MPGQKKGKKARKHDRNRRWCEAYRNSGKREINKARKLARHLKRYPWDGIALARLRDLSPLTIKRAGVKVPEKLERSPSQIRKASGVTLTLLKRRELYGDVA